MTLLNGVGGAFIFSEDPKSLADWYAQAFGLEFDGSEEFGAFYTIFIAIDPDEPTRKLDTTFALMKAKVPVPKRETPKSPDSMYGDQPFMLNLRTADLDALLASLEQKGIEILERTDEDYGKFAWIYDLDGNRLELYQPIAGE